jgi:uncharacterized membrane protein
VGSNSVTVGATLRVLRQAVLGLMALVALTLLAWQWNTARHHPWLLALSIAPLLLPLAGLARGHRNTYAWCSLLTIPYMALGVTELIADPRQRAVPAALLLLAFAWLVVLIAYLRASRGGHRS